MKKYGVLALLSFSNFIQAQQTEYDYQTYSNDSYQNYYNYSDQMSNDESYKDNNSTPSKDATDQNAPSNGNTQDSSNLDMKSTPSKDATEAERKNSKEIDKKEEKKPKSPHTFTSNVSIVSDYRFRGISQTMRRPAIQGGFDYSHVNGIYLGTWASNVDGTAHFYNNTCMEWDLYGGYKGKLFPCTAPDFTYNIGFIYYYYPGGKTNSLKSVHYNTGEFYVELTYKGFSIKYWQTLTDFFGFNSNNSPTNQKDGITDRPNGSSRGSTYIEANLTFDLLKKVCFRCLEAGNLNLYLHIGHQTVRHYEHVSFTDWRATLTQQFDWFNVFVSYVGTNAKHDYYDVPDNAFHLKNCHLGAQGVVFGVIRTF